MGWFMNAWYSNLQSTISEVSLEITDIRFVKVTIASNKHLHETVGFCSQSPFFARLLVDRRSEYERREENERFECYS